MGAGIVAAWVVLPHQEEHVVLTRATAHGTRTLGLFHVLVTLLHSSPVQIMIFVQSAIGAALPVYGVATVIGPVLSKFAVIHPFHTTLGTGWIMTMAVATIWVELAGDHRYFDSVLRTEHVGSTSFQLIDSLRAAQEGYC
jgi:hypothetical protein